MIEHVQNYKQSLLQSISAHVIRMVKFIILASQSSVEKWANDITNVKSLSFLLLVLHLHMVLVLTLFPFVGDV